MSGAQETNRWPWRPAPLEKLADNQDLDAMNGRMHVEMTASTDFSSVQIRPSLYNRRVVQSALATAILFFLVCGTLFAMFRIGLSWINVVPVCGLVWFGYYTHRLSERRPIKALPWPNLQVAAAHLVEQSYLGVGDLRGWTEAERVEGAMRDVARTAARLRLEGHDSHPVSPDVSPDSNEAISDAPPTVEAKSTAAPGDGVIPQGVIVELKRTDTWWSLAEEHLGTGEQWQRLVEANVGREASPGVHIEERTVLKPGMSVWIPDARGRMESRG